jgi:hypothetical protein
MEQFTVQHTIRSNIVYNTNIVVKNDVNKYVYENIYPLLVCYFEACAVIGLTPEPHYPTLHSPAVVLCTTIEHRLHLCVSYDTVINSACFCKLH